MPIDPSLFMPQGQNFVGPPIDDEQRRMIQQRLLLQNQLNDVHARDQAVADIVSPGRLLPPPVTVGQRQMRTDGKDTSLLSSMGPSSPVPNHRVTGMNHDSYTRTPAQWAEMFPNAGGGKAGGKGTGGKKGVSNEVRSDGMAGTGSATDPTANMEEDQGLKELKTLISKYESNKKLDLSPALALVDSWTGSRLQSGYQAPQSDEAKEQMVMGLKERLIQREADLKYKKAYLTQMAADRSARQGNLAEDRKLREKIAGVNAGGKASKEQEAKHRRLFTDNKAALELIAKKRYGDPDKDYDKTTGKAYASSMHQEILEAGQYLEDNGLTPPGTGYQAAISEYLQNPMGPDGASGGQDEE